MQFTPSHDVPILNCDQCNSTGLRGFRRCSVCHGYGRGLMIRDEFLYFSWPLSSYHRALRQGRKVMDAFRLMGGLIFGVGFIGFFFWDIVRFNLWLEIFTTDFWLSNTLSTKPLLWLGISAFGYSWYRIIQMEKPNPTVPVGYTMDSKPSEPVKMTWEKLLATKNKKTREISSVFTENARLALDQALGLAINEGAGAITPKHLFLTLLSTSQVSSMFIRLGISRELLRAKVDQLSGTKPGSKKEPMMSKELEQVIFQAYEIAYATGDARVRESELAIAIVNQWPALQEVLYDFNVESEKLTNVFAWIRIREKLRENYQATKKASAHRSKHGIDRAMTAVATPFLNGYSEDLTFKAQFGYTMPCVARDAVLEQIFRVIEGGQQSVLLVGPPGVGKMTIIEGIAERMIADRVPERLKDKRLVQLSTSTLLAGTTISGAQERLIRIMRELSKARNIILVVNNITDLMTGNGTESQDKVGMNVAETLAEYLGSGNFLTLATANPDGFHRHIANTEMSSVFAKVDVPIMDTNQSIQVLESKAGYEEYRHHVFFSYDAIAACVNLAGRFMQDQYLPESALALMSEGASLAHTKHGGEPFVTANDIAEVIGLKTGIPATTISEDESTKLLRLEEEMHKRVVGQSEAVALVANALRRARAEIRSQNRPIANFLFLGPTGVGKTELAKTIAEVYFGHENRMIRVDMSEYQDKSGVYRLIGQPGSQGTGLLTEAVREKPFSLILLDELEKADANILNLFLQVFDDGRLTDSVGRVIDFTNTIIIATSNAGTKYVQEEIRAHKTVSEIREGLIRRELQQYYRPEFLNRFDGIIVFKPLTRDEIKTIASYMLKRVAKDLEKRGVELRVEESALDALAEVGFDPEFGARPMRRAIQEYVEDKLASMILGGELQRRDTVVLGEKIAITIQKGKETA